MAVEAVPAPAEAEADETIEVPEAPPVGKQYRIDGMPVAEEYVVITGKIRVSRQVVAGWKLGKRIELTVAAITDSRKQKVIRNGSDTTGELSQQVVVQVLDLILDDE